MLDFYYMLQFEFRAGKVPLNPNICKFLFIFWNPCPKSGLETKNLALFFTRLETSLILHYI